MFALFLELARTVLFLSSSPHTFRLRMISSMVVLAPHGEVPKALTEARLATNKLLVSVVYVAHASLLSWGRTAPTPRDLHKGCTQGGNI